MYYFIFNIKFNFEDGFYTEDDTIRKQTVKGDFILEQLR